jgi:hypothetical protein
MMTTVAARLIDKSRYWEWIGLAAVLFFAAYLRLGSPGVVEYKSDEASLSQLALDLTHGRSFPLLGISSSVGIPNAPVNVYVLAIPYLFSDNPLHATQYVGLLNVIAIGFTYVLVRRYCGVAIALVVALMFAANPWAIAFSRKIWAQNMLPVFVVATVGTGIEGFIGGKRWAVLAHLPLLVLTGQIHYGTFVLIPVTLYLLWHGRRHLPRLFWLSLLISVILVLPYATGILRAGWGKWDAVADLGEQGQRLAITDDAIHGAALLISGNEIHALAGPEKYRDFLGTVPDAYPLFDVLAWAVLLSSLWLIVRGFHHRDARTPVDLTLLIWLIAPILAFSVSWTPFHIHYLIPGLPAAFAVLGFAVHDLWQALSANWTGVRNIVFGLAGLGLGTILSLQIWVWLGLLDFVDVHATPGGFGTPLHYLLDVREGILEPSPKQALISVNADGQRAVWATLLYDVPSVRFEESATHVYPPQPTVLLTDQCNATDHLFVLREDEGCYAIETRSIADFDDSGFRHISADSPPIRFANGVELVAYRWQTNSQMCLSLAWRIEGLAYEDFMFAIHLFDAQENRIAVADGLSWEGHFWQPGDLVVRDFCPPPVDGAVVSARIGMYTYEDGNFYGVDLLDAQGIPIGQMVTLPLD